MKRSVLDTPLDDYTSLLCTVRLWFLSQEVESHRREHTSHFNLEQADVGVTHVTIVAMDMG